MTWGPEEDKILRRLLNKFGVKELKRFAAEVAAKDAAEERKRRRGLKPTRLMGLNQRYFFVYHARWNGKTLREAGQILGVSPSRAGQMERRLQRRMKFYLCPLGYPRRFRPHSLRDEINQI